MADEHDAGTLNVTTTTPAAGTPAAGTAPGVVEPNHPADASLHAAADHGREHGDRTVEAGARDLDRPTGALGGVEGGPASEDNVYDRLAKKDNTPTESGGDVGVA